MTLCLKLLRRGVSARIEGRDIGKTLVAIARKINAKTVPQFIKSIDAWGQRQKARFLKDDAERYESRCDMVNDQVATLVAAAEGARSVKKIESRLLSLFHDSDGYAKPAVVLSSVHKAKGLEWNRVFLLAQTLKRKEQGGEETNIYYKAVTRAKQELVLVYEDRDSSNN